jgi:hypothetical protein
MLLVCINRKNIFNFVGVHFSCWTLSCKTTGVRNRHKLGLCRRLDAACDPGTDNELRVTITVSPLH